MVALVALAMALVPGSAAAAGHRKLVEGTVYDTTCATACTPGCPPPPHCGPVTQAAGAEIVCAQRQKRAIACPLEATTTPVCVRAEGCPPYPVYSGEGAVVNVRRRGSKALLATLPVVEGHFKIRLGAGEYVLHPYLSEEACWSGEPITLKVSPRMKSPVAATLDVNNSCVAHPDVR
ncbi:MAG TPA: hypothetical protein VHV53_02940 [Solirubrobacterales bacterium]|nr:hypothetical protein [Solirubrobacterales bacterium]